MLAHESSPITYDGPEAESVFQRSISHWEAALRHAKSFRGFPKSSCELGRLLYRVPSLPDHIPRSSSSIEGYSSWQSSDASCSLKDKAEKKHMFHLRCPQPTTCMLSTSDNFQEWEQNPNNGVALLVLGWAYIFIASLAERQHLALQYMPLNKPSGSTRINLDYASPQELTWWNILITRGSAYSIAGDNRCPPWAVSVDNLDLEIDGKFDLDHSPPTATQAAGYLARLCFAYDLGNQSSAALAAALSLPLHRSTDPFGQVTIELPRPSLLTRVASQPLCQYPTDFKFLDRYMALSLSPNYFSSILWSVFSEPQVPCNFAGAWLGPISDILRPIIQDNKLELLAKVLSFTNAAPLWLGLAICGHGRIIKSIMPFLDNLRSYPHVQPSVDAAAWTGIPQSFMDIHPPGPYLQKGKISRANVWRLRHDCHEKYEEDSFVTTPQCGWPPFGTMRVDDVELELRDHLKCSHQWKYDFWTWLPSGFKDKGLLDARKDRDLPQEPIHLHRRKIEKEQTEQWRINLVVSKKATEKIFWWCSSQVEKGFGGKVVPWYKGDSPPKISGSDVSVDFEASCDRVDEWKKTLLHRQRRNGFLGCIVVDSEKSSATTAV